MTRPAKPCVCELEAQAFNRKQPLPCRVCGRGLEENMALKHQFLWFDIETTCLDPHADNARVLEWALVLADDDGPTATFEIVQAYTSAVHWPDAIAAPLTPGGSPFVGGALRASCVPKVSHTHAASGLWDAVADPSTPNTEEADEFLEAVARDAAPGGGLRLAGYSVHFDLEWTRVHLPRFAACLSHHVLDVSALKAATCAWGPGYTRTTEPEHRALADVKASLAEARELVRLAERGWGTL
jgi:oligoribonuclease (3'-5' exoribonuclease)